VSREFDAFHLPRHVPYDGALQSLRAGAVECRYPTPSEEFLAGAVEALHRAGAKLAERPVMEIVAVLDAAAARLADGSDPLREEAERLVPAATGYSAAMTRLVLDRMCADWRADRLRRLLRAELTDPAALDRFVPAGEGRRARAYGHRLAFHIFAGNVPGVAVTSLVRSLLVKTPVLAKLASGEPVLPVLFARAVASIDATMGDAMAVTYWPGGATTGGPPTGGAHTPETLALRAADLVVVYGGEEVVAAVRGRVRPEQRLVVHGPRFSAGIVAAGALDQDHEELADQVARAVACFDQQGCVSPHGVWVEDPDGSRTDAFASAVAGALRTLEEELPRGGITPAEASLIHQERGAAELRGHAGQPVRVLAGAGTSWTVVVDGDATFQPSCLNRFLRIHTVPSLRAAVDALRPHGSHLQSVAVAGPEDVRTDLAHELAAAGATRVTTFSRLPWPPPEWHHDGAGPLGELLRWVDLED
jgi:acyl-CoA reductase-like NAD-dependent aldehyde dehydrogenase